MDGNLSYVTATKTDPDSGDEMTDPRIKDFVFYSEAYVETGILIAGFIFNIINFIVLKKIKMIPTFRICLLALTLSDACACLFGSIQLIIESSVFRGFIPFGYWYNAALASHLIYYAFVMFLCTSSAYVILVASVRAYMISQPYKALVKLDPDRLKVICILILIVTGILFSPSPFLALWQVCYAKDNTKSVCKDYFRKLPKIQYIKYYFYILSVIFGPLVIIGNIICLVVIHFTLKKAQKRADKLSTCEISKQIFYKRITKMLLIILILDTVWLLPTCIQFLGLVIPRDALDITDTGIKVYDVIAEILLLFRPTYNIFVYLCANSDYRESFKQIFCSCTNNNNNDDVFTSSDLSYNRLSNPHYSKQRSLTLSDEISDLSGGSDMWISKYVHKHNNQGKERSFSEITNTSNLSNSSQISTARC